MKHLTQYELFEKNINSIDSLFNIKKLNKKPDVLYHLSSLESMKKILIKGLETDYSKQHKFVKGIYLTDDLYTAFNYRYLDDDKYDFKIIEIPFNKLDINFMKPDDYELFDLIDDEYHNILDYLGIDEVRGNTTFIWKNLDYRHSLYICNQLIYTANISPDLFSNIYNEEEVNKKLNLK